MAVFFAIFSSSAQIIEDDFEYYTLGAIGEQNPEVWSTSNGVLDSNSTLSIVEFADSQAGYIGPNNSHDVLLLLLNLDFGTFTFELDMLIPTGSNAYMNIQGQTEINPDTGYHRLGNGGTGILNSNNLIFNQNGGSIGLFEDTTTGETSEFPLDEVFKFAIEFDLHNFSYQTKINDDFVNQSPVWFQGDNTLGGMHIFSFDSNTNFYINYMLFQQPYIKDIDDFAAVNFKLYPNPVQDFLTIQSASPVSQIEIFDMVGKSILNAETDAISPSIDLSILEGGIYLVAVTINQTTKTFKVVK